MGDTGSSAAGQNFPPKADLVMGDTGTTRGGIFLFPPRTLSYRPVSGACNFPCTMTGQGHDVYARPEETIQFHSRSGVLTATRNGSFIELDFPLILEEPAAAPAGLAEALGVQFKYVGKGRFDYLLEVESEATRTWPQTSGCWRACRSVA